MHRRAGTCSALQKRWTPDQQRTACRCQRPGNVIVYPPSPTDRRGERGLPCPGRGAASFTVDGEPGPVRRRRKDGPRISSAPLTRCAASGERRWPIPPSPTDRRGERGLPCPGRGAASFTMHRRAGTLFGVVKKMAPGSAAHRLRAALRPGNVDDLFHLRQLIVPADAGSRVPDAVQRPSRCTAEPGPVRCCKKDRPRIGCAPLARCAASGERRWPIPPSPTGSRPTLARVSRTRCSVLHDAPQSRDDLGAWRKDGPGSAAHRLRAAQRPGNVNG